MDDERIKELEAMLIVLMKRIDKLERKHISEFPNETLDRLKRESASVLRQL